jgi:hypothetical protein
MTRKAYYWPILVLGLVMIIAPFAMSMPSKTSAGQKMLDNFNSMMQQSSVNTTLNYYNTTFKPLQAVAQGGVVAAGETNQLMAGLAQGLHMTPTQLGAFMNKNYPAMTQLLSAFPSLVPVFKNVTPGLAWYKPLVTAMNDNVGNYAKVNSLPNFNLFTWFFVIPGALFVIFALLGLGLFAGKRKTTQP